MLDTSKGIIPLIPWSLAKENELRPFIYIFMRFNPNIKFFTSHNFVSLVTPEGLTNTWNNHYPPVRFLWNGSLFTTPEIRTDLSYDLATGGILVRRL